MGYEYIWVILKRVSRREFSNAKNNGAKWEG